MAEKKKFFALVGPTGAGKSILLQQLKDILPNDQCVFLCDSSSSVRFTTRVSQIAKDGDHECATPRAQLILFWARLVQIIEEEVEPNLALGKCVIMDGFGGTVFAHAMRSVKTELEREKMLKLHRSMIEQCVVGVGISAPTYLWLRPSPQVALTRLMNIGRSPRTEDPLKLIETLNREFEFYGKLDGQTVIPIDADRSEGLVLKDALKLIGPLQPLDIAA